MGVRTQGEARSMNTLNLVKAYLLGMYEFRLSMTTGYEDDRLRETYDKGRDMAHRLTFRYYDEAA